MSIEVLSKFKKLDEIDHVLTRPGMYIGSTEKKTISESHLIDINGNVSYKDITIIPGFFKLFDEIVSNSVDHSKRPEGKHINQISIFVDDYSITVSDNGGIPVIHHPEYDSWIPDFIFSELRSGTNFNDEEERTGTGQNGIGCKATNIFSTEFKVSTSDGKNSFECTYSNNNRDKSDIVIKPNKTKFTIVTFKPDLSRFGLDKIDLDHFNMILRRCWEIKATNPHLNVYFNFQELKLSSFKSFCELFVKDVLYVSNDMWKVGIGHSDNGFKHISFVNSTATYQGGNHVDYIADRLVAEIRDVIEKKTKQKIKPSEIKNHFYLFIDATIINPKYDSQTKERMITEVSSFGSKIEFDEKFIKSILKSDVVKQILEWAERKKQMEDMAALKKAQKDEQKDSYLDIKKYEPATDTDRSKCVLMVGEGDSARNSLIAAKTPQRGIFCLKGKPINVVDMEYVELVANEEFNNLRKILGLELGKKAKLDELRYSRLLVATDQDLDGFHISGLVINMIDILWPELIDNGFVYRLDTPIIKAYIGKTLYEFISIQDYENWASKQTKNFKVHYCKGLGGHNNVDFKRYMDDPKYHRKLIRENEEDTDHLRIAFDKGKNSADRRKEILEILE